MNKYLVIIIINIFLILYFSTLSIIPLVISLFVILIMLEMQLIMKEE